MVMPLEVPLWFRNFFLLSWVFVFPYEVDYSFFKVCEELCWDFDNDYLEYGELCR